MLELGSRNWMKPFRKRNPARGAGMTVSKADGEVSDGTLVVETRAGVKVGEETGTGRRVETTTPTAPVDRLHGASRIVPRWRLGRIDSGYDRGSFLVSDFLLPVYCLPDMYIGVSGSGD